MTDISDETLWYKIRFTPLRDAMRGRLTGRLDLRRPLAEAALPESIKRLLLQVVKATRLWRLEQLDVMQELIAHFADGIASGTSAEELITAFGDVDHAAQLIRRAKLRNRPMPWHVLRFAAWSFGSLLVFYLGYAAYFYTGHPAPKINYVELLNKPIVSIPVEDRAWTYYRRALVSTGLTGRDSLSRFSDLSTMTAKDRADISEFARTHQKEIEWIRQGASKTGLGWVVGRNGSVNDPELFPNQISEPASGSAEPLSMAALPSITGLRELAIMLRADEIAAAQTGDGRRLLPDIHATLGLSRQIGANGPLLLSLVSMSIADMTLQDVEHVLHEHSEWIAKQDWLDLMHQLSAPKVAADLFTFAPGFADFDDVLQRSFTDDGSGSGRFTADGVELILGNQQTRHRWIEKAAAPVAGLIVPSRRKFKEAFTGALTRADANLKLPIRNADWHGLNDTHSLSYLPISLAMPSYFRSHEAAERLLGHRDGVVTAIALALFHREHGSYPNNLNALVPQYLPDVPADRITGTPVHYMIKDGQPLIYSVGGDLKDDGGWFDLSPQAAALWVTDQAEIHKGDWVIYPTFALDRR